MARQPISDTIYQTIPGGKSLVSKINRYRIISDSNRISEGSADGQADKAESQSRFVQRLNSLATPLIILGTLLAVMWAIELADWILPKLPFWNIQTLDVYGIEPRATSEYWRIGVAPFLHADYRHLIANSIPLLVLGYLVIIRNKWHFPIVFVVTALVSGIGVWLFGSSNTIHIGASGIVFGFMGYLLGRGFFERSIVSILFGVIALLLYGSILMGVFPGQPGVSWLGHLFGLVGGVLVAYIVNLMRQRQRATEQSSVSAEPGAQTRQTDVA